MRLLDAFSVLIYPFAACGDHKQLVIGEFINWQSCYLSESIIFTIWIGRFICYGLSCINRLSWLANRKSLQVQYNCLEFQVVTCGSYFSVRYGKRNMTNVCMADFNERFSTVSELQPCNYASKSCSKAIFLWIYYMYTCCSMLKLLTKNQNKHHFSVYLSHPSVSENLQNRILSHRFSVLSNSTSPGYSHT